MAETLAVRTGRRRVFLVGVAALSRFYAYPALAVASGPDHYR